MKTIPYPEVGDHINLINQIEYHVINDEDYDSIALTGIDGTVAGTIYEIDLELVQDGDLTSYNIVWDESNKRWQEII